MRREKFGQHSGQRAFTSYGGFGCQRVVTDCRLFLGTINTVMPWQPLMGVVQRYWPKQEDSRRSAKPILWILKLCFLQIWCNLSDAQTEE